MSDRDLNGNWILMKSAVLQHWPRVTAQDIANLAGEREALMRLLISHRLEQKPLNSRRIFEELRQL